MKQIIDRVTQTLFHQNRVEKSSIELLARAHNEAPYASIFPLLEATCSITETTNEKKWRRAAIYSNHLLWWQYVMMYAEQNLEYDNANRFVEDKVQERITINTIDEVKKEEIQNEHIEKEVPSLSSTLSKIKESFDKPLDQAHVWIDLEPYHMVDYFASQGIKIEAALESKDKLSKQLKSFTAWLKTMKRIGPTPEDLSIDNETEQQVVNNAAHSIAKEEVVTETMAKVLEKQGKIDKAMDVYKQLIMLHPEKSDYFAMKISQLASK